MQTGTIFSGIGHAGLILWVLVGDWLFTRSPAEEVIVTSVSMITSEEFDALQSAATATINCRLTAAPIRWTARAATTACLLPADQTTVCWPAPATTGWTAARAPRALSYLQFRLDMDRT